MKLGFWKHLFVLTAVFCGTVQALGASACHQAHLTKHIQRFYPGDGGFEAYVKKVSSLRKLSRSSDLYYKRLSEVRDPNSPSYVPGFKVPTEVAVMAKFTPRCQGLSGMGNLRFTWLHENLFVEFWENGQALAQLKASVDFKTGAALHVSDVQVIPEARGRRISSELFAKALEIAGPRITSITPGEGLAHSNFEKVANRYFEITDIHSPDYIPGLTKAEATRIAVQASYFAKSIDQFGFTEVSDAKIDWFFADAWSPTSIVGIKAVFSKKTP